MRRAVEIYGASVRGPRNVREGHPNQDCWGRASGRFGNVVVVCDGLGSKPKSDMGARAACKAVCRAASMWPGISTGLDVGELLGLVEAMWRVLVAPCVPADGATTCAFCLREPGGDLVLAGIGDGLTVAIFKDGALETFGGRSSTSFANETLALGVAHRRTDWWHVVIPQGRARGVILMTDGVADDLAEESLGHFADWVFDEVGNLPSLTRARLLAKELKRWPVPKHQDDKTIVAMFERDEGHAHD